MITRVLFSVNKRRNKLEFRVKGNVDQAHQTNKANDNTLCDDAVFNKLADLGMLLLIQMSRQR